MLEQLLVSEEPSIRLRVRRDVLGDQVPEELSEEVRSSDRVQLLLSERRGDGTIPLHPYAKWRGAHWVLALLAELGYPPGDESLTPLREQVLAWLLSDRYERRWLPPRHGRVRLHASQDANAIWYLLRLGLDDERVDRLAARLLAAQWPDGGWNCDPCPDARTSSFEETLIPLRALARYGADRGDRAALDRAARASEFLLERGLYRRRGDGEPAADRFLRLAFPRYWHYDLLFALEVAAEVGTIADPRSNDALDVLEQKRLAVGGFPAETAHYRGPTARSGSSLVSWGGTSARRANEWVTAAAPAVLARSGR